MLEEWVPFVSGEDPWDRIGADTPEWVMAPGTAEADEAEAVPVRRPAKRKR